MLKLVTRYKKLQRHARESKSILTIRSTIYATIKIRKELSRRTQAYKCAKRQPKWWTSEVSTISFKHPCSHSMVKRHSKKEQKLAHVWSRESDWIIRTTLLTMRTRMSCQMIKIINSPSNLQFQPRLKKSRFNNKHKSITMTQNFWKSSKISLKSHGKSNKERTIFMFIRQEVPVRLISWLQLSNCSNRLRQNRRIQQMNENKEILLKFYV